MSWPKVRPFRLKGNCFSPTSSPSATHSCCCLCFHNWKWKVNMRLSVCVCVRVSIGHVRATWMRRFLLHLLSFSPSILCFPLRGLRSLFVGVDSAWADSVGWIRFIIEGRSTNNTKGKQVCVRGMEKECKYTLEMCLKKSYRQFTTEGER